jgi:hypothetical protein
MKNHHFCQQAVKHINKYKKFKHKHKNGSFEIITGGPRYSRGLRSTKIPQIAKPRIPSPVMT